jgi:hypothetical protein
MLFPLWLGSPSYVVSFCLLGCNNGCFHFVPCFPSFLFFLGCFGLFMIGRVSSFPLFIHHFCRRQISNGTDLDGLFIYLFIYLFIFPSPPKFCDVPTTLVFF